jgi:predicted RNA-binding Zn-ribbon protein involved in translation (DUF1610 family)
MKKYTNEIIEAFRKKTSGLPKSQVIKLLMASFKISHRQARRVNSLYKISGNLPKIKSKKIRRLFWDIETSPNIVLSWRVGYKINLDPSNILTERKIICIGYKWEGEKDVIVLHWDKNQDDKAMLEKFLEVANSADELVHQNGDRFDLPWFKTRCIFHGLQTLPDYKTVDTLKIARRNFYFNSNKLDYMAKFLGLGEKIQTHFGLWKEIVLNKCSKSMALMTAYCAKDVILLEKIYNKLRGSVKQKTHEGVLQGKAKWTCPFCGSTNVIRNRIKISASGTISHQMKCLDCGKYFTITDSAHEEYKLATGKK